MDFKTENRDPATVQGTRSVSFEILKFKAVLNGLKCVSNLKKLESYIKIIDSEKKETTVNPLKMMSII